MSSVESQSKKLVSSVRINRFINTDLVNSLHLSCHLETKSELQLITTEILNMISNLGRHVTCM